MEALRQSIFSIVTAALICGIALSLTETGPAKEAIRLLCGLFLTVTVLKPLLNIHPYGFTQIYDQITIDAAAITNAGEEMAADAVSAIIKSKTEAYILDKAAAQDITLTAQVILDSGNIPCAVFLEGALSPTERQQIQSWIEMDLGITKEHQTWTG